MNNFIWEKTTWQLKGSVSPEIFFTYIVSKMLMKTKYALIKHILDKIDSNRSNKLGCYGVQLELCLAGVGVGLPFFTEIVYLSYV